MSVEIQTGFREIVARVESSNPKPGVRTKRTAKELYLPVDHVHPSLDPDELGKTLGEVAVRQGLFHDVASIYSLSIRILGIPNEPEGGRRQVDLATIVSVETKSSFCAAFLAVASAEVARLRNLAETNAEKQV